MIRSFRHKGLRRFFDTESTAGVNPSHANKLELILTALDQARSPSDMDFVPFRLHPLKGVRQGQWAVTVAANWRVTFAFDAGGNAIDVDYEDYH